MRVYFNSNFEVLEHNFVINFSFEVCYSPKLGMLAIYNILDERPLYSDFIRNISSEEDLVKFSQKLLKNISFI